MKLQCLWKVRDQTCGEELISRINKALHGAGHAPTTLVFEAPNQVKAELYTPSIGMQLLPIATIKQQQRQPHSLTLCNSICTQVV